MIFLSCPPVYTLPGTWTKCNALIPHYNADPNVTLGISVAVITVLLAAFGVYRGFFANKDLADPWDIMTTRVYKNMSASLQLTFTEKELECIRVCVANAPIPYDIAKKKIPADILDKIGQPTKVKHEGLAKIKYDLTPYGIND